MFFRQILQSDLGCASYVIADGGEAAVIDPTWEIDDYLALAAEHGFRITHILETHNHADHLSGHGRLAGATGATIHISGKAEAVYAHESLADGDRVELGSVTIRALATPGHRPEHLSYAVEDRSRSDAPWMLITGDSLFVGDLARPDLAVQPREGARDLFHSLQTMLALEDFTEIWPGHIGGSLCGGAGMSEKPGSTLGYERRFNHYLAIGTEDQFVQALTEKLPLQPPNLDRIVELNRGPLVEAPPPVPALTAERVRELMDGGAILVDGRHPRAYDALHVPNSLNVTMVKAAVGTRAAWVIDPDTDVLVTADSEEAALAMAAMLQSVGLLRIVGSLAGGVDAWSAAGLPVETTPAIDVAELADRVRTDTVVVLDVRDDDEWEAGHVEKSLHVPFHALRDGVPSEVSHAGTTLAVVCSAGNRSSLAASLLRRNGVHGVVQVVDGGVDDVPNHGIDLVTGA